MLLSTRFSLLSHFHVPTSAFLWRKRSQYVEQNISNSLLVSRAMTTNWNKTFTCHARVVLTHYLEQFQRDFWAHVFMTHPVSGPFVLEPRTLLQIC